MGLLALLLSASASAQVTARLEARPAAAEIGQPVTWELLIEHPREVAIVVPGASPLVDDSWVLLEDARRRTRELADGRRETVVTWRVMSLEPGERALPPLAIEYDADGVPERLQAEAESLVVAAALAEGEDAPRPPVGFRPAPPPVERPALWPFAAAGALGVLALAALVVRRLRRGAPRPAAEPAPAERLAALEARRVELGGATADPETVRVLYYELSAIVRAAVDRRAAASEVPAPSAKGPSGSTAAAPAAFTHVPVALTDEEWLARMRARAGALPPEVPATVEELLRRAEAVKYGGGAPTRFAVDEAFAEARRVVEAVSTASTSSASGPVGGGAP